MADIGPARCHHIWEAQTDPFGALVTGSYREGKITTLIALVAGAARSWCTKYCTAWSQAEREAIAWDQIRRI